MSEARQSSQPRMPRPYYRKKRDTWYVQIAGREYPLGRDKVKAFKSYTELMARAPNRMSGRTASSDDVVGVIDQFLDWCHTNQEFRTYDWYRKHLQSFAESIPASLPVDGLKPYTFSSGQTRSPTGALARGGGASRRFSGRSTGRPSSGTSAARRWRRSRSRPRASGS